MNAPARSSLPAMLAALTVDQHREMLREDIAAVVAELMPATPNADDGPLDRAGAAAWLKISLAKLDALCRREHDPLPFSLCGDSRRFFRDELRDFVKRQRGGSAK